MCEPPAATVQPVPGSARPNSLRSSRAAHRARQTVARDNPPPPCAHAEPLRSAAPFHTDPPSSSSARGPPSSHILYLDPPIDARLRECCPQTSQVSGSLSP